MKGATARMIKSKWPKQQQEIQTRKVYPDFNVLTLEIIADAVFGTAIEVSAKSYLKYARGCMWPLRLLKVSIKLV
eukprot:scaffold130336_cov49-Prasinocladus_malaysianus.AAC.3